MWQRFTERARKVVFYAQEEARERGDYYVSTEHFLLGLIHEKDSVAARIFERLGVSMDQIRAEVESQITRGDGRLGQDMHLTPRAKRVIDLAYDEARQLNNNYIGTEHLLLGLIREGDGLAGRVLSKLGVDIEKTRAEVRTIQSGPAEQQPVKTRASRRRVAEPQSINPLIGHLSDLLVRAYRLAREHKSPPGPEHLFLAVLEDATGPASVALESLGVTAQQLDAAIRNSSHAQ